MLGLIAESRCVIYSLCFKIEDVTQTSQPFTVIRRGMFEMFEIRVPHLLFTVTQILEGCLYSVTRYGKLLMKEGGSQGLIYLCGTHTRKAKYRL